MNQTIISSRQSGITLKVVSVILFTALVVYPQNPPESEVQSSIRKQGMEKSQIMRTLHFLTDVYGPRLTGSPNLKAAKE